MRARLHGGLGVLQMTDPGRFKQSTVLHARMVVSEKYDPLGDDNFLQLDRCMRFAG